MKFKKPGNILVFSLGGSLVVPKNGIDIAFLNKMRKGIYSILELDFIDKIILVIGGGKTSRDYIKAAKDLPKVKKDNLDQLGIIATKLNAELVKMFLQPRAYHKVLKDPKNIPLQEELIIASGWKPGNSTDLNTVLWALSMNQNQVYNLTDVDQVYKKDPHKFPNAKAFEKLSWPEFKDIIGGDWKPGLSTPFGPMACKKASQENLKVVVLKGNDYDNIKKCIQGKDCTATVIG